MCDEPFSNVFLGRIDFFVSFDESSISLRLSLALQLSLFFLLSFMYSRTFTYLISFILITSTSVIIVKLTVPMTAELAGAFHLHDTTILEVNLKLT